MQALKTIVALAAVAGMLLGAPASAQTAKVSSDQGLTTGGSVVASTGATVAGGDVTFDGNGESIVVDAVGAGALSIGITGTFVGTIKVQWSNKPTSGFQDATLTNAAGTSVSTLTTAQQFIAPSFGRYLRIITTSWTSGSAVVTPLLRSQQPGLSQGGGSAGGNVRIVDGSGEPFDLGGDAPVKGATAADAPVVNPPVTMGCRASAAAPSAVSGDGDVQDLWCGRRGGLIVSPFGTMDTMTWSSPLVVSTTTETTLQAAGGAGVFNHLLYFKACNTSVSTSVRIDLRDASAGAVADYWIVPAGDCRGGYLGAPMRQPTANNAWTVQLSGAVTDVRIKALFVTAQ